jgi:arsenate reductase
LLKEHEVSYEYREYRSDPLSTGELREVLGKLGMTARAVLRARDAKKLGLRGDESDDELIVLMAEHPTLLQRPILVVGDRAALGRPVEALLPLLPQ